MTLRAGARNWAVLLVLAALALPAVADPGRVIELRVVERRIDKGPATIRLVRGERVTLSWTADEKMTVHMHGYDIARALEPGIPTAMPIEARVAGRFPVTAHLAAAARDKKHREPTLVYIEVHPE
jgi:hypothetical protein